MTFLISHPPVAILILFGAPFHAVLGTASEARAFSGPKACCFYVAPAWAVRQIQIRPPLPGRPQKRPREASLVVTAHLANRRHDESSRNGAAPRASAEGLGTTCLGSKHDHIDRPEIRYERLQAGRGITARKALPSPALGDCRMTGSGTSRSGRCRRSARH